MVPTPTTVSCSYYMSSSFSIRYIAERLFLFHFVECPLPPPPPPPPTPTYPIPDPALLLGHTATVPLAPPIVSAFVDQFGLPSWVAGPLVELKIPARACKCAFDGARWYAMRRLCSRESCVTC